MFILHNRHYIKLLKANKQIILADPFMVIATQNPVETLGTFPLPEAQLDRFLIKMSMNYPTHEEGVNILERFSVSSPLATLQPVATVKDIIAAQEALPKIFVHRDIMSYIVSLVEATRHFDTVVLGVSPRGAQSLMKVAKGYAAIDNRDYVMPDDVKKAALPVLTHRIMLTSSAKIKANAAENVINEIVEQVPVPTENSLGWAGK